MTRAVKICEQCGIERARYKGYCRMCGRLLIESGAISPPKIPREADPARADSARRLPLPPVPGFRSVAGDYSILTPCTAQPGSEAKLRVMEERMAAGFHLHHPLDLTIDMIQQDDRSRYFSPMLGIDLEPDTGPNSNLAKQGWQYD